MGSRASRIVLIVLGVIGLGLATYLTYVHYSGIKPACTAGESCVKVQTSVYAKLAGVPVALMGLIGYMAIMGTLLAPESENSRLATMTFTLIGFSFSAYLTYRELFSIHAICEWCASSAAVLTVMMALSVWRFLRGADDLDEPVRPAPQADEPRDSSAEFGAASS